MRINNISYPIGNQINNNNSKANNVSFEAKFIKNPADLVASIRKKENSIAQRLLNSVARILNNINPKAENKISKSGGLISKNNILSNSYIPGIDDKPRTNILSNSYVPGIDDKPKVIIHINSRLPKHRG